MNVMRNLLTEPTHLTVSESVVPTVRLCRWTRLPSARWDVGFEPGEFVHVRLRAPSIVVQAIGGRSPFAEPHPVHDERHDPKAVILPDAPGSRPGSTCRKAGRRSLP